MVLSYLPLVVAVLVVAGVVAAWRNGRVNLAVTRAAVGLFGDYVANESPRKREQRNRLRAAHVTVTHRVYASQTLLYAGAIGVAGSVLGVYVAAGALALFRIGGQAIRDAVPSFLGFIADLTRIGELTATELFPLLLVSSATVGAGSAVAVYFLRWQILDQRAYARGGQIETTLPRTIAFIYALSRSGMAFPVVLNTLARNEGVYGEAARELGVAVRDMNTFGTDVLTALERMSSRTPSETMSEFGENLASVLGSGRNLSEFLHGQYEQFQEEAKSRQDQYLELVSTFAEAYVTVLVAGPLFFITILVVIGIVLDDTLPLLRAVIYLGIPLASFGFVVYIDSITQSGANPLKLEHDPEDPRLAAISNVRPASSGRPAAARTDGGLSGGLSAASEEWGRARQRLAAYDRLEAVLEALERPLELVLARPANTMVVTVPVGLAWVWYRSAPLTFDALELARSVDSPLIESSVLVLGAYGLAYEVNKRRLRSMERAVPDFLDRMASINDAGMTVVESLERLTRSDLDALTPEVQRVWRDIQWGADASTALERMRQRVRSPMVSRAVALITNAIEASGDVAPVLEIAADEARATRRLRRERRQVMVTYLMVIYISFLVFLGIIVALTVAFIPAIEGTQLASAPSTGGVPAGVSTGLITDIGSVPIDQYVLLFYHAAALQGLCSGLIAGQLGEGSVSDGVKHATVLLILTYVTFLFI